MKAWCYRHPNVTFLLLAACYVWIIFETGDLFEHRRWGFAAIFLYGSVVFFRYCKTWWHRTGRPS